MSDIVWSVPSRIVEYMYDLGWWRPVVQIVHLDVQDVVEQENET